MFAITLVLGFLLSLVSAKPISRNLVVHERRDSPPEGFTFNGPAPESATLDLRIALVSSNLAGLEEKLYDVSTPTSANYGKHLSKEQVEAFVAPSPQTASAVNKWLASNGLKASPASPAGDWLGFSIGVQKANELLGADFGVFTHQANGQQTIRTLSYSIPESLRDHVQLIHPTTNFPVMNVGLPIFVTPVSQSKNLSSAVVPASCATQITPACLQALYGIPSTPATVHSNQLGVSGFIGQYAQDADLSTFLTTFRPDMNPATTFALQSVDGGINPQGPNNAGIEANLDIQYTIGVATGVPTTFISVGTNNPDGVSGFLDIINFLLAESAPPQVLTTSYGFNEGALGSTMLTNLCNAYMQLGARGVSILFASGDGGVSGIQSGQCKQFVPTFPSGCPFVTSVGGTTGISPETSASFSGGGFSNFFARPSYQSTAVSNYLTFLGSTYAGKFNSAGRAFPDISAQAENVLIFSGGRELAVAGTSCSSPIFASVVSLLNDKLAAKGKPALGFLNPFLYSTGIPGFTDVTTGSNPGCRTNGFPATTGWDPVTGFGTPNFASLSSILGV